MTTLPQTTLRLPRATSAMQPLNIPAMMPAGGFVAGAGSSHQRNGADVWRVIRCNMWLIGALLIASVV
ncbi:MAG: hypothetical protein ABSH22_03610, partial [Tepidisphaeraceae bacterium]